MSTTTAPEKLETKPEATESAETAEALHILGDMADKIKNNVKEQPRQFSWKLKFPKDMEVNAIPEEAILLLNNNLKRLRCEFIKNAEENAILISPQNPYKPNQEYFFWAKYKKKEICVAFVVSESNTVQTFEQKASIEKLNALYKKEARKAEKNKPTEEPAEATSEAENVEKADEGK